jgi:5-bromo-4-chloroindolyl phosphate hydrolysis protein
MKDLFLRLKKWFLGLPWVVIGISEVIFTLILVFLVKGTLFWTDFLIGYIMIAVGVVFIWKKAIQSKV